MKRYAILLLGLMLVGCNSAPQPSTSDPTSTSEQQPTSKPGVTTSQAGGGNEGGIAPMTTAPIGNAPVAGGESVDGGGSAVGTVAKDRAKQAAAKASGGSLDQGGE